MQELIQSSCTLYFIHPLERIPLTWCDTGSMDGGQESPSEGPYNHVWITGDNQAITDAAQSEIDDIVRNLSCIWQQSAFGSLIKSFKNHKRLRVYPFIACGLFFLFNGKVHDSRMLST
ncbi:hypothetical protein [Paenibacillus sonchi]|uniref:hypothetical protein n=1 Tax=Paenibacillus sonchi TaxID=373687 RepID=UPI001E2E1CCB|nr:hypothetical protein [Paenibacillus sonchi]MCE3201052.1 hypothetical protein [Paenibacillus sonchi]